MTPIWTNGLTALYQADAREIPLPDQSVHCVVTSPPYWGQRDYNVLEGIGLEGSLGEWAESLVSVFREVGRVLRNDGTLWLNVGDAYTGSGKGSWAGGRSHGQLQQLSKGSLNSPPMRGKRVPRGKGSSRWGMGDVHVDGMPPKNLMGLPWRLALALQDDGWWLRSEIIWHKPNPMPGSQKDRPTSSHETIFLLAKQRRYFYDYLGFREKAKTEHWPGIGPKAVAAAHRHRGEVYEDMQTHDEVILRDVWTFPPQGRKHAHEAAFPDELPRRCILLGTSAYGVCAECGAPWERVVDVEYLNPGNRTTNGPRSLERRYETAGFAQRKERSTTTTGWQPTCSHNAARVPAMVLDPFVGSGTTCAVAQMLGRRSAGIDLSKDYLLNIARPRLEGIALPMELGV